MRKLTQRLLLPALALGLLAVALPSPMPARAAVTPLGQQGCPNGQAVATQNLVQDSDFAEAFQGTIRFVTDLPDRGPAVYPSDPAGGFSIQKGAVDYQAGTLIGRPFPGDPSREVLPSETYFYSNPYFNADGSQFFAGDGEGKLWGQTVAVTPGTTYNFYAYFDNILLPGTAGNDPVIELRVDDPDDGAGAVAAGLPITVTKEPDTWVPIQYAFQTGPAQTRATLEIWDVSGKFVVDPIFGSDFGMVGINLRQCASAIGLAKAVGEPIRNSDGSYDVTYTLTVRNYGQGAAPVTGLQVTDDLSRTFAYVGSYSVIAKSASANLSIEPAYTGVSPNTRLLTGADSLASGETATITFTVRMTPGRGLGGRGPFPNRAIVTANSGTATVEDDSAPGSNPDADGDNNPKEDSEDLDTVFHVGTVVGLPVIIRR